MLFRAMQRRLTQSLFRRVKKRGSTSLSTPSILCSADGTIGTHCSPSQTRCACVRIVELTILTLTRQSSSFVGLLIVGLIADSTGNIRYALFFLVIIVWLAVPVLLSVNVDQGRIDAQTYSVERVHEGQRCQGMANREADGSV